MVVLIMEKVPVSLRGEITRWLLEAKAGVFIGNISSLVREKLWQKACSECEGGTCLMFWNSQDEQGFKIEYWGLSSRIATDWEGLQLMTKPPTQ